MTRFNPIYLLLGLIICSATIACNEKTDTTDELAVNGNCIVSAFKLARNEQLLSNLDSVYFAIDLMNAEIFNADSLPKGTDVSKLVVSVTTSEASECNLTYRIPGTERDTTVNYIKSPGDSINFASGPVKMEVVSNNKQVKRTYTLRVNVHQSDPDTLYWTNLGNHALPTTLSAPVAQKTVRYLGQARVYTIDASGAGSMAICDNPDGNSLTGNWHSEAVTFPADARIETIATSGYDALYMLTTQGDLYTSTGEPQWTSTGVRMNHIYGILNGRVIGAVNTPSGWKGITYPGGALTDLPAGIPVSGTSETFTYSSKWTIEPLMMFVGGSAADGSLSGDAWAYDGVNWAKLSTTGIEPRTGAILVPYFVPVTNKVTWAVTDESVLLAIGGTVEIAGSRATSRTVFISYNLGMTWKKADSSLQLPTFIPAFEGAQALVFRSEFHASRSASSDWTELGSTSLPVWARSAYSTRSRMISGPVTEWDAPYIYMFGGRDSSGKLMPNVWRGVINRFTFKPIQ